MFCLKINNVLKVVFVPLLVANLVSCSSEVPPQTYDVPSGAESYARLAAKLSKELEKKDPNAGSGYGFVNGALVKEIVFRGTKVDEKYKGRILEGGQGAYDDWCKFVFLSKQDERDVVGIAASKFMASGGDFLIKNKFDDGVVWIHVRCR